MQIKHTVKMVPTIPCTVIIKNTEGEVIVETDDIKRRIEAECVQPVQVETHGKVFEYPDLSGHIKAFFFPN